MSLPGRIAKFLVELKRRKVYQVGVIYLIVAIGALELADVLVPATNLPEWSEEFFVVLAIVGLPGVLVLAWLFDVTSAGVRRTSPIDEEHADRGDQAGGQAADEAAPAVRSAAALDPKTIALLPFGNLSADAEAEPFAAGLHDDLLTELSRASALTVISRTSVQRYRGTDRTMREIGQELGAGTIVEGGVQKAGNRVRLNVQLIDARSDAHLWAERYDRELSPENIFELQTELAARIMAALRLRLTGAEEAEQVDQPTDDLEAYRQYSIGRALFVDRTEAALRSAIEHFERAVERDPEYALAWAWLGQARVNLVDYGHLDSAETLESGRMAAERALALDPRLAEAHSAMGVYYTAIHESRKSLEAHTRAAALRPGFAGAHQWRCWASLLLGDPGTAAEAGAQATRLDPLDPEARGNLALAHLGCGHDEEALAIARAGMADHPEFDYTRWVAALALYHLGRRDEASETMRGMHETWSRFWPETASGLDRIRAGDGGSVRDALARQTDAGTRFHAGLLHAALGETDAAFEAIESRLPLTWDEALYLRYFREEPIRSMRADPRWGDVIAALDRGWGA